MGEQQTAPVGPQQWSDCLGLAQPTGGAGEGAARQVAGGLATPATAPAPAPQVGKLGEHITDLQLTPKLVAVAYLEAKLTLVMFGKSSEGKGELLSSLEPRLVTLELPGPPGRRLDRRLEVGQNACAPSTTPAAGRPGQTVSVVEHLRPGGFPLGPQSEGGGQGQPGPGVPRGRGRRGDGVLQVSLLLVHLLLLL